nr:hypothetical protein [Paracidovorax avenae]
MDALSNEIMALAFRTAPEVADPAAEGWEQYVRQYPEFAEKADLLCRAQVRCDWTQCCAHVIDDPFNRDSRIATFKSDRVEDLVSYQRKQFFMVTAGGDIKPGLSTFQNADLEALKIWWQALRSDIDCKQQVQSPVIRHADQHCFEVFSRLFVDVRV